MIVGNLIGTDASGLIGLGNGLFGVLVSDASGVVIGGSLAGDRNVISGNTGAGVGLFAGTTGAAVEGNLIGTDVLGSSSLGNGIGVQISRRLVEQHHRRGVGRGQFDRIQYRHRGGRRRHRGRRQCGASQFDLLERRAGYRPGRRWRDLE